ncbi:hypothetical protein DMUE_2455, partial [Dictyocoela muelleri]
MLIDHGKQYVNNYFKDMALKIGIRLKTSTIFNPTGNSISERINKTINEIMRMYSFNLKAHSIQNMIENRLNLITHSTLKVSLLEIFIGKSPFTNKKIPSLKELIKNAN